MYGMKVTGFSFSFFTKGKIMVNTRILDKYLKAKQLPTSTNA